MFRTWGPDKVRVQFAGERERQDQPDGFQVELNYAVRTPEGEFEFSILTRGVDDPISGGRDWQIVFQKSGLRQERRLTKLGRLCAELQYECARRYLRRWLSELARLEPDAIAAVVRLEGAVPPAGLREKLIAELRQPDAINPFPGAGPMRGAGLPTVLFSADAVRLTHVVEATAPAADKSDPKIPTVLTIRVINVELERELLKLAGPDWDRHPLLGNDPDPTPELEPYGLDNLFQVTEVNLRPSQPRIAPAPQNAP
jgi:hypothetical protein